MDARTVSEWNQQIQAVKARAVRLERDAEFARRTLRGRKFIAVGEVDVHLAKVQETARLVQTLAEQQCLLTTALRQLAVTDHDDEYSFLYRDAVRTLIGGPA